VATTTQTDTPAAADLTIRDATDADWPSMWSFMEPIVRAGETFSWDRELDEETARSFWMQPPPGATLVAVDRTGRVVGTAEIARNHGGGAAHIANAGFMADPSFSGHGAGRALGEAALERARADGFRAMQFNAVVATNERAVALWHSLGFQIIGTVPDGYRHPTRGYVGLHIMYRAL
jgi:RimJ/RimL family protein N-acetyltransferase